MHSIRMKIMSLTIAAICISVLSIGGMSVLSTKNYGDQASAEKMTLICDNCRQSINKYLNSIEQSVDMISRYALDELNIVELSRVELVNGSVAGASAESSLQQYQLDLYLRLQAENVEKVFRSVANHTNGIITYYYRFNPELTQDVKGFLYSRINHSEFREIEPTEISRYAPDDIAHVGWYYIPLQRGRPSWLEPYYNENLGIRMVSYVTPIYKAGTFIGVIGMDISYSTLISQIENIRVYDTGYAMLTDGNGNIVSHPSIESGLPLSEVDPDLAVPAEYLKDHPLTIEPIRYRYGTTWKQMCFNTLSNGMKLIVIAPLSEINATWVRLTRFYIIASTGILLIFTAVMFLTTQRITEPLLRLAAASRHLAAGDYHVVLDYHGNDEVGVLTDSFQQLVRHLRIYISDLNSRAYQDAMTGVKNKAAFHASAKKLNDAIRMGEAPPEFALAMLDCNNLKKINDQYGHDKGDIYLKTACELICRVFAHSPVFRLGGDEFAVLLQNDDYMDRADLLIRFGIDAENINCDAAQPWEEVHIAIGLAVYDPERDHSVDDVLQRADTRMYTEKKRQKACRA